MAESMITRSLETKLIAQAKQGDGHAIAELIRAHQDALYAFILRMSHRPEIAEDIVQEAFVRVLKNLDRFDTRFRFSTWRVPITLPEGSSREPPTSIGRSNWEIW